MMLVGLGSSIYTPRSSHSTIALIRLIVTSSLILLSIDGIGYMRTPSINSISNPLHSPVAGSPVTPRSLGTHLHLLKMRYLSASTIISSGLVSGVIFLWIILLLGGI